MPFPTQMSAGDSALLIIDVQEKLLPRVVGPDILVRDLCLLIDAARLLEMPILATEQYPKGLGPTIPELTERLSERPAKLTFSCCGLPSIANTLYREARPKVVLAGIEAHVCVLQTALDLLAMGFRIYIPADGVSSRRAIDRDFALQRVQQAGAILTTIESCLFEWLGTAGHPHFKTLSQLIKERDAKTPL